MSASCRMGRAQLTRSGEPGGIREAVVPWFSVMMALVSLLFYAQSPDAFMYFFSHTSGCA